MGPGDGLVAGPADADVVPIAADQQFGQTRFADSSMVFGIDLQVLYDGMFKYAIPNVVNDVLLCALVVLAGMLLACLGLGLFKSGRQALCHP